VNHDPKQDSVNSTNVNSTNVFPVSILEPGYRQTEFTFDENKRIATLNEYDSGWGIAQDTLSLTFNYSDASTNPSSYDYTWTYSGNPPRYGATEHHMLRYDDQGRIIVDSMTSRINYRGAETELYITNYAYSGENIVVKYGDVAELNTLGPMGIDSIFISNGNLTRVAMYASVGNLPTGSPYENIYTYSTYNNPLYQANLSKNLGVLFIISGTERTHMFDDFISPKLPNKWNDTSITYNTDSSGKVVQVNNLNMYGTPHLVKTYQY
jgi:hypothetical protein